jgi:hypothetical protein
MKSLFHKHVIHRTKRYAKHLTKYLYERDTVFATLSVFVFLFLLGMIPINFYVLNPMKMALKDFDFNDMRYAKLVKDDKIPLDTQHVVIVNIGRSDRAGIAHIIELVKRYEPKVIGLDALFVGEREPEKDSLLSETFRNTPNLVVGSYVIPEDTFKIRKDYFDDVTPNKGYVNFVTETIGTRRYYTPFEIIDGKKYPSFTSAILKKYNEEAYKKLEARNKEVETISYSRRENKYFLVQPDELENDMIEPVRIKNKIVLLGYVNTDPNDIEDKMFTPMNEKFAGKSHPDMNGIVVHANIISMVMEGRYVKKMPAWVAWLFAALIGWLHMSLYIRYYLEDHIWFHLIAKLTQVFSVIFFAYLGMIIYDKYRVRLDMKYTLYVIALAVDVIYFYEALVTWLHKKFGYATIFGHHHHDHGHDHKNEHKTHEQNQHSTPDAHHH